MQDITKTIDRELLRLATAGSVDNGKSTLIGRLLYDCRAIYEDQFSSIEKVSRKKGLAEVDFSLLTDGLSAEREQGITIDVAYRYLNTDRRRIIMADVPGHEQYTRNMVTGCSNADAVVILLDAQKGLTTQSKRHLFIASMMKIQHILIVVNKMDAAGYREEIFLKIKKDCLNYISRLNVKNVYFIPISAVKGDMVVFRSAEMHWYNGDTLMERLNRVETEVPGDPGELRLPVQLVIKGEDGRRRYAGKIESGSLSAGEEVCILPSNIMAKIEAIFIGDEEIATAQAGQSVSVFLSDEIDLSRGDLIAKPDKLPEKAAELEAVVCCMDNSPLEPGRGYLIKQATRSLRAAVSDIFYRVNVDNLYKEKAGRLYINEIGRIGLKLNNELFFDPYEKNKYTGSFILIDELSKSTAAAGIIVNKIK